MKASRTVLGFGFIALAVAIGACGSDDDDNKGGGSAGAAGSAGSEAGAAGQGGSDGGGGSAEQDGSAGQGGSAGEEGGSDGGVTLPTGCAPANETFECSPLSGEGCDVAGGETCDQGKDDQGNELGFICFEGPNDAKLGEACDPADGPYCGAGMACIGANGAGTCAKFCCADADCTSGETCMVLDASYGTLGVCATSANPDGGTADAADDGATDDAASSDASDDVTND